MNKDKKDLIDPGLAEKMREVREAKGLTQAKVAKLAKVSETYYAMTERVETNPAFAKLNRMLKALGLEMLVKKSKT